MVDIDFLWLNPFPNKPVFLQVCSTSLLRTLEKGESACCKIFYNVTSLLFPLSFQKTCTADTLKRGLIDALKIYSYRKHSEKRRNCL